MERFPIGFWNYTTGQLRGKDVQDWVDLGMTMANSPEINDDTDPAVIHEILDACRENDIKVILCDNRLYWHGASDDPVGYEERMRRAYEIYGTHPAVFGFQVGDEPGDEKAYQDSAVAYQIQEKVAPHLTPFLNLLSWVPEETIDRFREKTNFKILSYDDYSQMEPGETGVHDYFRHMRGNIRYAETRGVTPWITLLSVGHFDYRCPNEDDLRWQLNTAVASGMKGIMWFFIYERMCRINYRVPPIDCFGLRTETFNWLARTNKYFLHQFGDFFLRAKHLKTVHLVKSYGEYPLWEPGKTDDLILDIRSPKGVPAVLGFFELDGKKYVSVVNNSTTESAEFDIHVPKNAKIYQLNWHRELFDMRKWRNRAETDTEFIAKDWHAPGQMKLYCVEP